MILGSLFFDFISSAITSLSLNAQEYTRAGQEFSSSGSLGDSLILSQPTVIQIPLKILSLFFYPIPIWHGFTVPSSYAFFKSLHLLFNLFYLPLLVLSTLLLSKPRFAQYLSFSNLLATRSLLVLFVQAVLVVALSSSESRHLGVFYPASIVVAAFLTCFN